MVVNVCPAGVAKAPTDRIWELLTTPERFEEWQGGARLVSAVPPGPLTAGQLITLSAPVFGRWLRFTFDIGGVDPNRQWIDLTARFPLGIVNREHITLTPSAAGGTLVRFN
ncbi:MAG TPA: hypothetical protein VFO75_03030 [Candidatus Dormibacteraeota bacterium]|nr:hypothetical protein [Candidatus Dormibacteraeota bacterium]